MRHILIVSVAAVSIASCARARSPEVPLIINKNDPGASAVREAAEQANASLIARLETSGSEIWALPADRVSAFSARSPTFRVASFELIAEGAPSLVPPNSLTFDSLNERQREAIAHMVAGLPSDAYRITEGRPTDVGRYFLGVTSAATLVRPAAWREALGSRLSLELVGQRRIVMVPSSVEQRAADDLTWRGTVEGGGSVTLTVLSSGIDGTVVLPDATYSIRSAPDNLQVIHRKRRDPPDHPTLPVPEMPGGRGGRGRLGGAAEGPGGEWRTELAFVRPPPSAATCSSDQGETIDLLFAVTPAVASVATVGRFKHAIDLANDIFKNSGLAGQLRYQGLEPTTYHERSLTTDFEAFQTSAFLKERRNAHRADVVAVVLREPTPTDPEKKPCGYSGAIAPPLERALAVIEERCLDSYTLAHEVGHLMGSAHESGTHVGSAPFEYAHGYVDGAKAWRTVMATENQCPNECQRVPLWSSPLLRYPANAAGRTAGVLNVSEDLRVARDRARILATARCR